MFGRISFLISCGSLVAGSAWAKNNSSTVPILSPPLKIKINETPAVALHIEGWEIPINPEKSTSGEVWIGVNSSWRAAWR